MKNEEEKNIGENERKSDLYIDESKKSGNILKHTRKSSEIILGYSVYFNIIFLVKVKKQHWIKV